MIRINLLIICFFALPLLPLHAQQSTVEEVIKAREAILANKGQYKKVVFDSIPEYQPHLKEGEDYIVDVYSRRTYYLDKNDEVVYILSESDHNSAYPYWQITKGMDEHFFKDGMLINNRSITLINIPYKGKPVSDTLINFDYMETYDFRNEVIEMKEESYFFHNEVCFAITKKETKGEVKNYEQAFKDAEEKELNTFVAKHIDLAGKSNVREAKSLLEKLKNGKM